MSSLRGGAVVAVATIVAICPAACTVPDEPGPTGPVPERVLSPAVSAALSCPIGSVRGIQVEPEELVAALDDHVPRSLPDDFGLLVGWRPGPNDPTAGGAWSDGRCRTIVLRLGPPGPPPAGPAIGPWRLVRSAPCSNGVLSDVSCLEYRAPVGDGHLVLSTVGVAQEQADAVVASIPV